MRATAEPEMHAEGYMGWSAKPTEVNEMLGGQPALRDRRRFEWRQHARRIHLDR